MEFMQPNVVFFGGTPYPTYCGRFMCTMYLFKAELSGFTLNTCNTNPIDLPADPAEEEEVILTNRGGDARLGEQTVLRRRRREEQIHLALHVDHELVEELGALGRPEIVTNQSFDHIILCKAPKDCLHLGLHRTTHLALHYASIFFCSRAGSLPVQKINRSYIKL